MPAAPRITLAASVLAAATVALGGCGASAEEKAKAEPVREGLAIPIGGIEYNVFLTRELNLADPEDRDYYDGPGSPPGAAYYGVFVEACNEGEEPSQAARDIKVVDTQGNEFRPLALKPDNIFAYRPSALGPGQCIPDPVSIPAGAPTGGALLLFLLPQSAGENRPLELEIVPPSPPLEGELRVLRFELDI